MSGVSINDCIAKIQARATERVRDDIESRAEGEDPYQNCESPIEKVLLLALVSEIEHGFNTHKHVFFLNDYKQNITELEQCADWWLAITGEHTLFICPQAKLESWRVDFLISTMNYWRGKRLNLIVECDGHAFHERTKLQAARDRSRDRTFQELGYTVFRFTGSEIWHDPCGCAEQIALWADTAKHANKPKKAAL